MYAAVRTALVWPEKTDEAARLFRRWSSEVAGPPAGVSGFLALAEQDASQVLVAAFYDSPEALATGGAVADTALADRMALFAVPPLREVYEVVIALFSPPVASREGDPEQARVTTLRVRPEQIDEAVDVLRQTVLGVARQQYGNRGFVSLVDRASGKTLHITLWDAAASLAASETSGNYQRQVARLAPFLREAPTREVYEVIARNVPEGNLVT